jgi:hypothetical protein
VVRNSTEIADAVALVNKDCDINYRRPKNTQRTKNKPPSFEFDDLRLYAKMKMPSGVPDAPEFERIFEVQVRTFLLHAWSIATHDLTYKTDDVSWSRARIAFQVRAMLEHAELSIRAADELAKTDLLDKEDYFTGELREMIAFVKTHWAPDQLPSDLRRLAQNINSVLAALDISRLRFQDLIVEEASGPGLPLDENAYQTTLRLLIAKEEAKLRDYVATKRNQRIVLYEDLELPDWIKPPAAKNVVLIGA